MSPLFQLLFLNTSPYTNIPFLQFMCDDVMNVLLQFVYTCPIFLLLFQDIMIPLYAFTYHPCDMSTHVMHYPNIYYVSASCLHISKSIFILCNFCLSISIYVLAVHINYLMHLWIILNHIAITYMQFMTI